MLSKSGKKNAIASGTLMVIMEEHHGSDDAKRAANQFEKAVDRSGSLVRISDVRVRVGENGIAELSCEAEYGPVCGANSNDLRKLLAGCVANIPGREFIKEWGVVKTFTRTLEGAALEEAIAKMEAQADDLSLPLAKRKSMMERVAKLAVGR
jgi:hypothetical protein